MCQIQLDYIHRSSFTHRFPGQNGAKLIVMFSQTFYHESHKFTTYIHTYIDVRYTYHATLKEVDIHRVSSTHPSLISYSTQYIIAVTSLADPRCPVPSVCDQLLDPISIS